MSTKSTIFLTNYNEHCYVELADYVKKVNGQGEDHPIIFEMDKDNVEILTNSDQDLIVEIKPGTELYDKIMKMRE